MRHSLAQDAEVAAKLIEILRLPSPYWRTEIEASRRTQEILSRYRHCDCYPRQPDRQPAKILNITRCSHRGRDICKSREGRYSPLPGARSAVEQSPSPVTDRQPLNSQAGKIIRQTEEGNVVHNHSPVGPRGWQSLDHQLLEQPIDTRTEPPFGVFTGLLAISGRYMQNDISVALVIAAA
jgi:hypothetical protein